jgi:hypothetical protein
MQLVSFCLFNLNMLCFKKDSVTDAIKSMKLYFILNNLIILLYFFHL